MGSIQGPLDILQIVAVDVIVVGLTGSIFTDQDLIARQEGYLVGGSEVGEDQVAELPARIGEVAEIFVGATGFCGLLQALSFGVVEPSMKGAADPAVLDATVGQGSQPVGAVESQQSGMSPVVSEQDQVLAHDLDLVRFAARGDFTGKCYGLPVASQPLPTGGPRPRFTQDLVLFPT